MAFPPNKNGSAPPAGASEEAASASESESESESESNASESKMKGAKPNPLRKWAADMADGSTEEGGDY